MSPTQRLSTWLGLALNSHSVWLFIRWGGGGGSVVPGPVPVGQTDWNNVPLSPNRLLGSWGGRPGAGAPHCPTGELISSGSLPRCSVCRRLWTKQALSDSPPFPALVIHQPPFSPPSPAMGLASEGWQGQGRWPQLQSLVVMGMRGSSPTAEEVEEGQAWWWVVVALRAPLNVLPPSPLLLRLKEFRNCPDVGVGG